MIDAMALDSGGSVTLVSRAPGNGKITVRNVPSDFSEERYVTDALFVYSSAPLGTIVTTPRPHVEPTPLAVPGPRSVIALPPHASRRRRRFRSSSRNGRRRKTSRRAFAAPTTASRRMPVRWWCTSLRSIRTIRPCGSARSSRATSMISSGETVSAMAARTGAVAGINADYFDIGNTNQPLNVVVRDGALLRTPSKRAAIDVAHRRRRRHRLRRVRRQRDVRHRDAFRSPA